MKCRPHVKHACRANSSSRAQYSNRCPLHVACIWIHVHCMLFLTLWIQPPPHTCAQLSPRVATCLALHPISMHDVDHVERYSPFAPAPSSMSLLPQCSLSSRLALDSFSASLATRTCHRFLASNTSRLTVPALLDTSAMSSTLLS
jgi:hypothetical protein